MNKITLCLVAVAFGVGCKLGSDRVHAQWQKDTISRQEAYALELKAAQAKEIVLIEKVKEAQGEYARLQNRTKIDAHRSSVATRKLREQITELKSSLPTNASASSCRTASTSLDLLGECAERYTEMARKADENRDEAVTLYSSWLELEHR